MEQLLLAHASLLDYSIRDSRGKTLLHHLAWSSRTSCQTFERVSARSSSRLNSVVVVDGEQRSVLHLAAQRGNVAVLEYILTHLVDLDINMRDGIGRTPLHHAIESSRAPRTIELLTSLGADINAIDNEGCSAMDLAAKRYKEAAVQALGDPGLSSKPSVKDDSRQSPVQVAEENEAQIVISGLTHQ